MGKVITFKKLDFSDEAEALTEKTLRRAFWPIKACVTVSIISFLLYLALGKGNLTTFLLTDISKYLQLAIFFSAFWLVIQLKFGLKCPNCKSSFFKFTRKLQVKPRACSNCQVIFVKKTHPIEDENDFSREFYLQKTEIERRVDVGLFYLVVGLILFLYIIYPFFSALIGSSLTIFILLPVMFVLTIKYLIKQLETKCPSCYEYIKWTELKPTEISKHCPHCNAKLVR